MKTAVIPSSKAQILTLDSFNDVADRARKPHLVKRKKNSYKKQHALSIWLRIYMMRKNINSIKKLYKGKKNRKIVILIFWCFDIWYLIFDNWNLIFNIWQLTFDSWYLTVDIWYLTFNIWQLIFDCWFLTVDIWYSTFNI